MPSSLKEIILPQYTVQMLPGIATRTIYLTVLYSATPVPRALSGLSSAVLNIADNARASYCREIAIV